MNVLLHFPAEHIHSLTVWVIGLEKSTHVERPLDPVQIISS